MALVGTTVALGEARLRTAPELATLLLELGRLIRARRYYPPGDPRLAAVFERSLRAWQADLVRRGPLDLDLLAEGFRERGARGVLAHPRLAELERDLAERGVQRLRFEADLDADAFGAFAEVLAGDAGRTASRGGFAAALYALSPSGILVNGVAPSELPAPARASAPPPEAAPAAADAAPAGSDESSGSELERLLAGLESCDGARYPDQARRAALLAGRAFDEGRSDEAFRVCARLAAHTRQREAAPSRGIALGFLRSLLEGRRLGDLIHRAAAGLDAGGVEAAPILRALGEPALPALLDAAGALERGAERDRLVTIVSGFAERAVPVVLERLRAEEPPQRLRGAIRIAGDLRHPDAVAPLRALLDAGERGVREEALRALAQLGSESAIAAISPALSSPSPALAVSAIHALGGSASAHAAAPLRGALERALEARDSARAKELIRALGRLGRAEAAPALVALLERRVRIGGGWLRELKSAALAALGGIPGDEAVAALAQAAQSRDQQLRRAAQTTLERRALARARSGS
jgi:HEAT repeat protein